MRQNNECSATKTTQILWTKVTTKNRNNKNNTKTCSFLSLMPLELLNGLLMPTVQEQIWKRDLTEGGLKCTLTPPLSHTVSQSVLPVQCAELSLLPWRFVASPYSWPSCGLVSSLLSFNLVASRAHRFSSMLLPHTNTRRKKNSNSSLMWIQLATTLRWLCYSHLVEGDFSFQPNCGWEWAIWHPNNCFYFLFVLWLSFMDNTLDRCIKQLHTF